MDIQYPLNAPVEIPNQKTSFRQQQEFVSRLMNEKYYIDEGPREPNSVTGNVTATFGNHTVGSFGRPDNLSRTPTGTYTRSKRPSTFMMPTQASKAKVKCYNNDQ